MESGAHQSGRDRRGAPRYRVDFRARWEGASGAGEGTVTDLSATGCFVLTDTARARSNDLLRIDLYLPNGKSISLWGTEVYTAEEIGFGVRFTEIPDEGDRRRLGWLLEAEARKSVKGSGQTTRK